MNLHPRLRDAAVEIGWRLSPPLGRSDTVPLMYHGIPRQPDACGLCSEVFERQMLFLRCHFEFATAEQALFKPAPRGRVRVLLTFDDGFRNNVDVVVPILRRLGVPALFFISTRHLTPGKWLWFVYVRALRERYTGRALQFRGEAFDFAPDKRDESIARIKQRLLALRPHPQAMYQAIAHELPHMESFTTSDMRRDCYDGMSEQDALNLARDPLFTVGAHTVDHPMLTLCSEQERREQLMRGRTDLERVVGSPCDLFAYPADNHDDDVRRAAGEVGFRAGFSIHRTCRSTPDLTIPRVGVYYPGLAELGFKIRWSGWLRKVQQWKLAVSAGSN